MSLELKFATDRAALNLDLFIKHIPEKDPSVLNTVHFYLKDLLDTLGGILSTQNVERPTLGMTPLIVDDLTKLLPQLDVLSEHLLMHGILAVAASLEGLNSYKGKCALWIEEEKGRVFESLRKYFEMEREKRNIESESGSESFYLQKDSESDPSLQEERRDSSIEKCSDYVSNLDEEVTRGNIENVLEENNRGKGKKKVMNKFLSSLKKHKVTRKVSKIFKTIKVKGKGERVDNANNATNAVNQLTRPVQNSNSSSTTTRPSNESNRQSQGANGQSRPSNSANESISPSSTNSYLSSSTSTTSNVQHIIDSLSPSPTSAEEAQAQQTLFTRIQHLTKYTKDEESINHLADILAFNEIPALEGLIEMLMEIKSMLSLQYRLVHVMKIEIINIARRFLKTGVSTSDVIRASHMAAMAMHFNEILVQSIVSMKFAMTK
ncbi:hypothetical protein O9G_000859 [Rozella allomycis CSF55]|uniref:Uncharacterized protein n=1 Tax=Rozella allomycis (strain CSF55) TaxID=988480 RepID=A0A075AW71_ROZAC|nr:hypothetical protein O9G_000859 [Rozella allomycis CSF55]|eukprot:EPZ32784.1 hypothetical protein O9G_000859 [Rozella allomycis CSF55]